MFQLNFNLLTSTERRDYIAQFNLSNLTPKELELCSNYILFGKDETGKSEVDKKNIFIETKYNSYNSKKLESLDELMENPNFNEQAYRSKIRYKVVKPSIDRVKDADIPTMKEIWENIDELQHLLDVNTGKIKDENSKKLTDTQIYKLKHTLISIRRGQYYLKDIFKPTSPHPINKMDFIPYEDAEDKPWNDGNSEYAFAPLGLIDNNGLGKKIFSNVEELMELSYVPDLYNHNAKYIIDFRNPKHVYQLLGEYESLATEPKPDISTSLTENILKTLDYYIARANLKEQHYTIIKMKKLKYSNKQITQKLNELYGLNYTENYISTIWTQKICVEIAEAAKLHYDEFLARDDEKAWKVCNTCGKKKLRDNRLFVKKCKSADGLSNRCKICDRIARERNKQLNNGGNN